jgi:uncharacterized protein DUF3617
MRKANVIKVANMTRGITILAALGGLALLTAAQQPSTLGMASPGDWELSGVPGAKTPVRQCVADLAALAQFEHRGKQCSRQVISDRGNSTVIQYTCAGADFGRTQIDVLTPRSLRISTQGISDGLPFNYVLQARRMGDCTKSASASRH